MTSENVQVIAVDVVVGSGRVYRLELTVLPAVFVKKSSVTVGR